MSARNKSDRRAFVKVAGITAAGLTLAPAMHAKEIKANQWITARNPELEIWFKQAAEEWMQSVPIGNGRLGAMVFGGTSAERIALNEITLWAGQPDPDQEIACGKEKLAEIRQLFFEGKIQEGNTLAYRYLSGKPNSFGTHIPLGELLLDFGHDFSLVSDYRRCLNLENAVALVEYSFQGVHFSREYFCSNPDQVIVIRLSASRAKQLSVGIKLDCLSPVSFSVSKEEIAFEGKAKSTLKVNAFPRFSEGGVEFAGAIRVKQQGGRVEIESQSLQIKGASEILLYIDIQTNYKQVNPAAKVQNNLKIAVKKGGRRILADHIIDYRQLFERVRFTLEGQLQTALLPTNERLDWVKKEQTDPGFYSLFFQFNRYLLIACSRKNSPLPANLQGLWNDNLAANMPWTCDYHLDINTQQNYWAANVTNLAECHEPLFDFIKYLQIYGQKTARKVYGSEGWVAHTVCNVWGYTAPGEWPGWGLFPTASTWIVLHLWEQYQFTQDWKFLADTAYPLLKDNAIFFLDYMVMDASTGYLMTGPTTSPENAFRFAGSTLSLSMMPTCDRVLVLELFQACRQAAVILQIDADFVHQLEKAMAQLPPLKIGKNGGLQEWLEDYEEAIPNHRHTTHLLGLYPYAQIGIDRTPELANACRITMEKRMAAPNWEDVEWSRGNMINFYARLQEGDLALNSLYLMLKQFTSEALLTFSVAGIAGANSNIFILDGNQSACAGTAEMLVQSQDGYIEFLPALPKTWKTGEFDGLCVRGGGIVGATWKNGKLLKASLKAEVDQVFYLKWRREKPIRSEVEGRIKVLPELVNSTMKLDLKAGWLIEFFFTN